MVSLKELVDAGVQFGHVTAKRNPNMDRYIWGVRNKVNLIDVSKTAAQLRRASKFLEEVAKSGKQILWVGTKKPAQDAIREVAGRVQMPYVDHRWVGGTLSNYAQVKKSVTKLLHYEDIVAKADKFTNFTKKELNVMQKAAGRLDKVVGGIKKLTWPIGAVVLVDVGRSDAALKEAVKMNVPVVAIIDTNDDPTHVEYPIPANDDAASSILLLLNYMGNAVERGVAAVAEEKKRIAEEKKLQAKTEVASSAKAKKEEAPKKAADVKASDKKKAPAKTATKAKASASKETSAATTEDAKPKVAKKTAAKASESATVKSTSKKTTTKKEETTG